MKDSIPKHYIIYDTKNNLYSKAGSRTSWTDKVEYAGIWTLPSLKRHLNLFKNRSNKNLYKDQDVTNIVIYEVLLTYSSKYTLSKDLNVEECKTLKILI